MRESWLAAPTTPTTRASASIIGLGGPIAYVYGGGSPTAHAPGTVGAASSNNTPSTMPAATRTAYGTTAAGRWRCDDAPNDADHPHLANLVEPQGKMTLCGMTIDLTKLAAAADRLGADKLDVLSISGYRDARGRLVPDYDSVRIERRAPVPDPDDADTEDSL